MLVQAKRLIANGIGSYEALHAAWAIVSKADVFVTTDDRLLKRLRNTGGIAAKLPQDALAFVERWYEN